MAVFRCPGQDSRFWKPEDIFEAPCSHCKKPIEFFKDDPFLTCPHCGQQAKNPRIDLGCAEWCAHADKCIGVQKLADPNASLCDALVEAMKALFGDDERRICHALKVLEFADRIVEHEKADPLVVKAAAVLHDIGIQEAERKHGSSAGKYQEIEGPPIARRVLEVLSVDPERVAHVCKIVGSHHSARDIDTLEFRIIWDADWLVSLPEERPGLAGSELDAFIERTFKTGAGRQIAKEAFLPEAAESGAQE